MSALPPKADMLSVKIDVCFAPRADINHHLLSAVVTGLIRLFQFGGTVEIRPSTPWHGLLQLLRLFDLPSGFVVGYKRRAATDRVVKVYISVGNRSRYTFIFPRTTDQGSGFVVEDREHVVAIYVGVNAAPVNVICLSHHAPVIEAANRHVVERAFSFDIPGDASLFTDDPRAGSAIDFCHSVSDIVGVVFRAASLRKLRRCSGAAQNVSTTAIEASIDFITVLLS